MIRNFSYDQPSKTVQMFFNCLQVIVSSVVNSPFHMLSVPGQVSFFRDLKGNFLEKVKSLC